MTCKNEKWYCLRHPETHQEVRTTKRQKAKEYQMRGYELMDVVAPFQVSKNVKA